MGLLPKDPTASGALSVVDARDDVLLEMAGINKSFPGVRALHDVGFSIRRGEILALLGENGAGKSTLIKMLAGVHRPDSGQILLNGEPADLSSTHRAQRAGIQVIYQEHTLAPDLTAVENIFLGREAHRGGLLNDRTMLERARELFREFGADEADLNREAHELGALRQRLVEIIKALAFDAQLVIMDEPTAALPDSEREALFGHIRRIKERGISVLLVTHRLDELFGLVDRAVVLRDGENAGELDLADGDVDTLVRMMVGREIGSVDEAVARQVTEDGDSSAPDAASGDPVLVVEALTRGNAPRDVSFRLNKGEILGVAGMAGSGRTELARAIIGADRPDAGRVLIDGKPLSHPSPRTALAAGIALVPEERKVQGILGDLSIARNISISSLSRFRRLGAVLDRRKESEVAKRYIEKLEIRTPTAEQKIKNLSGGNQQKAVVARALFAGAKVVIFDEPTQGIDVGAKLEIYRVIQDYVETGGSVIVISSELNELLAICDRILVMHRGSRAAEVIGRKPGETQQQRREREEEIISFAADGKMTGTAEDLGVLSHG